jgi:hypothetical protein
VKYLKIFEEFSEFVMKLITPIDVIKYNQMSSEGVFNNKVFQILSYNCGLNGLRVRKYPYENPTKIKVSTNDFSLSAYFFLRNVEDRQVIICKSIKGDKELYMEMGISDFMIISKSPISFFNKLFELFTKVGKDKYITPIQRLG